MCCPWGVPCSHQIEVLLEDDAALLSCQLCKFFLCCDSHPWLVHSVSAWKPSMQFRVWNCVKVNASEEDSKALLKRSVIHWYAHNSHCSSMPSDTCDVFLNRGLGIKMNQEIVSFSP